MTHWSLDRYCAAILDETDRLHALVKGADVTARVPTCPAWNLGQLLRHVGGAHRWAETVVRTRATQEVPHDLVDDVFHYDDRDPAVLGGWLTDGARELVEAFAAAGEDVRVWTAMPDQPVTFWARHALFETVVHRADAAWTVGAAYTLDPAVARHGLDVWMGFGLLPEAYEAGDGAQPLLGEGRSLCFTPSDRPGPGWFVDLGPDGPRWEHAGGPAAATVRGPLADLLLLMYGRPVHDRLRIHGDRLLLDLWLRRTGFWLN
ncbi:maleylpyruvate isomerase family mycothiol-dependent enzyme [Streptomyces sp. NPDC014006]|uniref:maleylpyruvate isomerase family mycothiol-dependent enzyme n=1 Tax=Streptomyces sp. NPDC014006 TaxID=3364870 RepID=UPI003700BE61